MRLINRWIPPLLVTLLMCVTPVAAENIRGPVVGIIEIVSISVDEVYTTDVGLEDLLAVSVSEDGARFIEGLEISIRVPDRARGYRDSFALYVYKNISPYPSVDNRAYRGNEAEYLIVPASEMMRLQIPVGRNHSLSSAFDSPVLNTLLLEGDSPIFLTVLPVMKGLPSSAASSVFSVSVKPLFRDRGIVYINLTAPKLYDPESVTVTLDGVPMTWDEKGYVVTSGFHDIEVAVPGFQLVTKRTAVNRGSQTAVPITLTPKQSTVSITAPEGTEAVLDGKPIVLPVSSEAIEPGEHVIVFKLGGHSISKKFTVSSGESVTLGLLLDITVDKE